MHQYALSGSSVCSKQQTNAVIVVVGGRNNINLAVQHVIDGGICNQNNQGSVPEVRKPQLTSVILPWNIYHTSLSHFICLSKYVFLG